MPIVNSCLRCIVRLPKCTAESFSPVLQYYQFPSINDKAFKLQKRFFKSEIHTDNLYPGSKVTDKFSVIQPPSPSNLPSFNGVIPVKELEITYTGSSAPGGQNVNKSSTKVEARFNLENATWLNKDTKDILREKWKGQLTKDGFFVVKSERTRSQLLNQVSVNIDTRCLR